VIKAIIFDMDGVLVDAREWHYSALNKALKLFGFEVTKNDHEEKFDGLPTSKKLDMLSNDSGLPTGLHKLINQLKQEFTFEIIVNECRPQFQHEYALAKLKQDGYLVAVASNSISATIELMMQRTGLLRHLDFYLSNEDVKNPKPSPEIYDLAISKLGCKPNEIVVVEDNENGIRAAKLSGANVLQVNNPKDVTYESILSFIKEIEETNA
jgi:HAD superfamily hydrolase (TIGR01509 family)